MEPGDFLKPMLATTADAPFSRPGWWFEAKWDGYRAIISVGRQFRIYSRQGHDLLAWLPSIGDVRELLPENIVLDAELVGWVNGRPSFADLQRKTAPAYILMAFDCLYCQGRWLLHQPLAARQAVLRRQVRSSGSLVVSGGVEEEGEAMFRAARDLGVEGVMAKRLDSPYLPGQRSRSWQKFLAVAIGWFWVVAASQSQDRMWYWTIGEDKGNRLRRVGRVPAPRGWRPAGGKTGGADVLNTPFMVEVEYRERTREGYLRHARIRRWREGGERARPEDSSSGTDSLPGSGD